MRESHTGTHHPINFRSIVRAVVPKMCVVPQGLSGQDHKRKRKGRGIVSQAAIHVYIDNSL
jgi:hypothetical protein